MADFYERLMENLGKLQRNESQMTEEQKKQYAAPLKKLKNQISEDATEAMKQFITMGMRITKEDKNSEDWKDVIRATEKLMDEWQSQGKLKEASKILFTTYDLNKFLEALCQIHTTVWVKAYGAYWLKHITETGEEEYPYYNDILDMHWWKEANEWAKTKIEDGKRVMDYFGGVTIMLPPTKILLDEEYKREMERYERR
jgi:hypothetical protein|nr:MAG TPA: hypothetical protein [Caudoviricetes sp.]